MCTCICCYYICVCVELYGRCTLVYLIFFFKQKTAYEMRISDWSSDVCSSDLSLLVALGCSREEVLLHERDAQGLCAYVGTYCSDKFLGVCLTKKKVYCCFECKLSRTLQEQGRRQLRKPWDKPKEEQRSEEPTSELQARLRSWYAVYSSINNAQTVCSHQLNR